MPTPMIFPVCITIDVSASMAGSGAIDAVNTCLPDLKQLVLDEPLVAELARVGIITFDSTARVEVPLTDLSEVEMPVLSTGGATSYRAALSETHAFLEQSIRALGTNSQFYKPLVFFLTDGLPIDHESTWLEEARNLRSGKYGANVLCFGFGDADPEVLQKIGPTFLFRQQDVVAAVREVFRGLIGSLRQTSQSRNPQDGSMRVEIPPEIMTNADFFLPVDQMTV